MNGIKLLPGSRREVFRVSLRDELQDLVQHAPEGVTTVEIDMDWLRRELEAPGGSETAEDGEEAGTYLTTSEAARRLSVKPETIARWCRDGRFPDAFKTDPSGESGEWRIPAEDVRSMRERNTEDERIHFERN